MGKKLNVLIEAVVLPLSMYAYLLIHNFHAGEGRSLK